MSEVRTPWLLFMPDGTFDGLIWSPKTGDEAGRKLFNGKRGWGKAQREGWTVRKGEPGEHLRLTDEAIARHSLSEPTS